MIRRRNLIAGAGALLAAAGTARAGTSPGFVPAGLAGIQPILDRAVAAGGVPGAVSLIWRRGEVAQVNTAGLRDVERRLPMQRDTIFRLASMGKPVTTATALTLVDAGRMRLDDPITRWAPEFANMRVLKRPDGPLDETYPAPRDITIEDLMTHRSGIGYGFSAAGPLAKALNDAAGDMISSPYTPDEWIARLAAIPLAYAPGERFHYGHSTDLLGLIVGRAAKTSFRSAMLERVCAPLGMKDTDFWIPPAKRDRQAQLYVADPARKTFTPLEMAAYVGPKPAAFSSGGQGLVGTADDYLTFARMLMGGGRVGNRQVLKPETARLMTMNRLTSEQRRIPVMFGPAVALPFWATQGFGLGVSMIVEPGGTGPTAPVGSVGAFTWPGLFGGWWQADPVRDLVAIWLVQAMPAFGPGPPTGLPIPGMLSMGAFQRQVYASLGD